MDDEFKQRAARKLWVLGLDAFEIAEVLEVSEGCVYDFINSWSNRKADRVAAWLGSAVRS